MWLRSVRTYPERYVYLQIPLAGVCSICHLTFECCAGRRFPHFSSGCVSGSLHFLLTRFKNDPKCAITALEDIHTRASYDLLPEVLLVRMFILSWWRWSWYPTSSDEV